MLSARLPIAAATGHIVPPVLGIETGPLADHDARLVLSTQPDHDRARAAGHDVAFVPQGHAATVVVALPRSKALARDRIARAAELCQGKLLVDGQKTDGIESILKELRRRADIVDVLSKAHGKMIVARVGDMRDWMSGPVIRDGWTMPPGAFSADGPDPGSRLLVEALPRLSGHVVDLGAGWGFLSRHVLGSTAVSRIDLVEADRPSLDAARLNVDDPRARFHWADATTWRPETPADHVVCNPPFHPARRAEPSLGRAFIAAAAAALAPRGTLWLVANRHLAYEQALDDAFARVEPLAGDAAYKLFRADVPKRGRRATMDPT